MNDYPSRLNPILLLMLIGMPALIVFCVRAPLNTEKQKHSASLLIDKAGKSKSTDKAVAYLEQAIRLDSLSAEARIALAERYESVNLEWKAESVLLSGYAAGIREPALLYHLGRIGLELNKYPEAALYLERIPLRDTFYLPAVFLLARFHIHMNDFYKSKKWIDTLSRYDSWKNKPEVQSLMRRLSEKGFVTGFHAGSPVDSITHSPVTTRYDLAVLAGFVLGISPDSALSVVFEDIGVSEALYPVCAAAVQKGFLEILPDGKFHPLHQIKKRNLAFYLFNWLKTRRFGLGDPTGPSKSWKDLTAGDPHAAIFKTMDKFGIIPASADTIYGANDIVSGKEAVASFVRTRQLLNNGN